MSDLLEAVAPVGPPLPQGLPAETALGWVLALERSDATPALTLSPREEALRAEYTQYPHRLREWSWGRFALKTLAAKVLGLRPGDVEVLRRESGAPELHVGGKPSPLFASLSHTRRYAVAAVGATRVGVDVADDEDGARLPRIAKRVMSAGEAEGCGAFRTVRHQAGVWAIKEAVLKLREGGVFDPGARSVRVESLTRARVADASAAVWLMRLPHGAVALAGEANEQPRRDAEQAWIRSVARDGAALLSRPAVGDCAHVAPWRQRVHELPPGVRLSRCTACGGRLRVERLPGAPYPALPEPLELSLEAQRALVARALKRAADDAFVETD
ncbi:MAG: 4'-phosphopantetheinyl transferase superfamily protein [Myxococcaceae bacterium]|nr:4'-phosphopantetheinyl transferase superfamily protein [Myxococcaceae bacterium]